MPMNLKGVAVTLCLLITMGVSAGETVRPMVLQVKTDNAGVSTNDQFTLPLHLEETYDFTVRFDGQDVQHSDSANLTLTFPSGPGVYDIEISGTFPGVFFDGKGDYAKLVDIKQWGDVKWKKAQAAFENCSNMTVSATDTPDFSAVTNMNNMFWKCRGITTIDVTNWDVSNVTSMVQMFRGCTSVVEYKGINTWDVSKVTTMHRMFYFNRSLPSIDLSNWNPSSCTDMAFLFYRCDKMTVLTGIGDWDVSRLRDARLMFERCVVATLDLTNWNTASIEDMSQMFASDKIISVVGLENFKVTNLHSASGLFGSRSAITTAQYDALLESWSAQISNSGLAVLLGVEGVKYTRGGAAEAGRTHLVNNNWLIYDGGPVNNVPIADSQQVAITDGAAKPLTLTGSDADGDALIFKVITAPTLGTLSGSGVNIVYTPNSDVGGMDSFSFVVSDGIADSAPATVSVRLNVAYWDGGGVDENFSTPENWVGDKVPGATAYIIFGTAGNKNCIIDSDIEVAGIEIIEAYTGIVNCQDNVVTVSGTGCSLNTISNFNADTGTLKFTGDIPKTLSCGDNETFAVLDFSDCDVAINNPVTAIALKAAAGAKLTFAVDKTVTVASLELLGEAGNPIVINSATPGKVWKLKLTKSTQQTVRYAYVGYSWANRGAKIINTEGGVNLGGCSNWLFGTGIAVTSSRDSIVSPAWVEGLTDTDAANVAFSVNGGPAVPASRMGTQAFYADNASEAGKALGITLTPETPTVVTVSTQSNTATATFNWLPTDITKTGAISIRAGSTLLLTATGTGALSIDGDGDGTTDYAGTAGDKCVFSYDTAGTYVATAELDGRPTGTLTVHVVDYIGVPKMGVVYNAARTKKLTVTPAFQAVSATTGGSDLRLSTTATVDGIIATVNPTTIGTDKLYLRLGGNAGPVLTVIDVETFKVLNATFVKVPTLRRYEDGTNLVGFTMQMEPYFPGYSFQIKVFTAGAIFEESGSALYWANSSDFDKNKQYNYYLLSHARIHWCHGTGLVREEGE